MPAGCRITLGRLSFAIDLAHLAFATAIAGWCAWYCLDAWRAQKDVENLIMILPATAAAVILYVVVAVGCIRAMDRSDAPAERPAIGRKVVGSMALLLAYVTSAPLSGFDVVSFAYILAMLLYLGERRIVVLLLVPTLFCAVAIYCFDTILATPLPLLLFPGDAS